MESRSSGPSMLTRPSSESHTSPSNNWLKKSGAYRHKREKENTSRNRQAKNLNRQGSHKTWQRPGLGQRLQPRHDNPGIPRLKITEPLLIAGERAKGVDIKVTVKGGGVMGQAEAVRIAMARALAGWTKSSEMRKALIAFERGL